MKSLKFKNKTQGKALIFILADKERKFIAWCKRAFKHTKKVFVVTWRTLDKINLKNPLAMEQHEQTMLQRIVKKANEARKKKRGLLDEIDRQQNLMEAHGFQLNINEAKCKYVPTAHRDITFNSHLVSKFGAGE